MEKTFNNITIELGRSRRICEIRICLILFLVHFIHYIFCTTTGKTHDWRTAFSAFLKLEWSSFAVDPIVCLTHFAIPCCTRCCTNAYNSDIGQDLSLENIAQNIRRCLPSSPCASSSVFKVRTPADVRLVKVLLLVVTAMRGRGGKKTIDFDRNCLAAQPNATSCRRGNFQGTEPCKKILLGKITEDNNGTKWSAGTGHGSHFLRTMREAGCHVGRRKKMIL